MADAVALACGSCSKRKIKCDKGSPCLPCQSAGRVCVPIVRPRLPRGRKGGRKNMHEELKARLSRLEELVQSQSMELSGSQQAGLASRATPPEYDPQSADFVAQKHSPNSNNGSDLVNVRPTYVNGTANSSARDVHHWMGSTLWTQLSNELTGIYDVLADDDDQDLHVNGQGNEHAGDVQEPASIRNLLAPGDPPSQPYRFLNDSQVTYLLHIFRQRVDPVVKIVHAPSLEARVRNVLQASREGVSTDALSTAALYACISSLREPECVAHLGRTQIELHRSFRAATEHSLYASNFLLSSSVETLQTLIFYLVALRSGGDSQASWTLLGIALRISQALNLHREESYLCLPFFEQQIRRRLYYCLLTTDFQMATDRGTDVLIAENGFSTQPPLHIRDAQFSPMTNARCPETDGFTAMTFFAITNRCARLVRQINFVQTGDMDRPPSLLQHSWSARYEAVTNQEISLRKFMDFCDPTDEYQASCLLLARTIISSMRLYAARPLQRHPQMGPPPSEVTNVLALASEVLNFGQALYNSAHQWEWVLKSFVDWHPMAVLLVELCTNKNDIETTRRAWQVVDEAYQRISEQIADGTQGPLWTRIKRLRRFAEPYRPVESNTSANLLGSKEVLTSGPPMPFELDHTMPTTYATDYAGIQGQSSLSADASDTWKYWETFMEAGNGDLDWLTDLIPQSMSYD